MNRRKIPQAAVAALIANDGGAVLASDEVDPMVLVMFAGGEHETIPQIVGVTVSVQAFRTRYGPVIRIVLAITDDPTRPHDPLVAETFVNPSDPIQMREFRALATSDAYPVTFLAPDGTPAREIVVTNRVGRSMLEIEEEAREILMRRQEPADFDAAKRVIIDTVPLGAV